MSILFPTFEKLIRKIVSAGNDRYSFWLCIFSFFATTYFIFKASAYLSMDMLWNLMPYVFFGFISFIFSAKNRKVLISWRVGITFWFLIDIFLKIQITFFPGSSTDCIAWLYLPLFSMLFVFSGFSITYIIFSVINGLKVKKN